MLLPLRVNRHVIYPCEHLLPVSVDMGVSDEDVECSILSFDIAKDHERVMAVIQHHKPLSIVEMPVELLLELLEINRLAVHLRWSK